MDAFQATSGPELTELRAKSAASYGDKILQAAAKRLSEISGSACLDEFRDLALAAIAEPGDDDRSSDMVRALAIEEFTRVVQLADQGLTNLRGWTTDGPAAIEEKKP